MRLNVLFFGATAETVGKRRVELDVPADATAGSVLQSLLSHHPKLRSHQLLYSVNEEYASGPEKLSEGDELAVFTAVSGG
jgi:molybdopterin converting factor small subunit